MAVSNVNRQHDVSTTRDNAYRDYRDLIPIETKEGVHELLKAIWKPFVAKIDIHQSDLVDALISCGIINDDDNESLSGSHLPTRHERARRLLDILRGISCEKFTQKALPVLCEKAGFLIPASFWKTGSMSRSKACQGHRPEQTSYCVRCDIKRRVRLPKMADLLYRFDLIDGDTHSDVTRHFRTAPPNWHGVFRAFENLPRPTASRLQPEMEKILSTHGLHVPCDLVDLMTQGLPCRCSLAIGSSMDSLKKTRLRLQYETLSARRFSDASIANEILSYNEALRDNLRISCNDPHATEETHPKVQAPPQSPGLGKSGIPTDGVGLPPEVDVELHGTTECCCAESDHKSEVRRVDERKERAKTWSERTFQQHLLREEDSRKSGRTKHMSVRLPLDDTKLVTAILRELLGKEDVKENVTSDQSYVSGTPDAKGYSIPDRLGTSIRDTQGTSIPDTQGTVIADTQGSTIPHTQDINIPDSQGTGTPDTQGTGIPDSQGSSIPESQDTSSSDMQGTFEQSDTVREQSRQVREPSVEHTLPTGRCSAVSTRSCHRCGTFPRPSTHRRPQVQQERSALGRKRCQTVGRQGGAHTADMLNLRTDSVSAAAVSPQSQTENIVRGAKSQTLSSQTAGGDELSASANSRVFGSQADDAWAPPGVNLTKNLRNIQTTLYKGEYERQQNTGVVSEWTVCSSCTSFLPNERQNYEHNWEYEDEETSDCMSEVVPSERSYTDGIGESDHTSNQGNQNQPEESDAVQTRDLEAARQNNDLKHLHEYVASEVTIEKLAELLRRAAVLNVDARNNLSDLIHDHYEQEQLYQDLCETLYNIVDKLQSGDYESSTEIQQHLADIDHFCKDLLDYGRTLILCSIYLEITTKLTTERTCLKADQAAGDLLVLIECAVLDVSGKLHSVRKGLENTDIDRCLCDEFGSKVWSFLDGF